MRVAVVNIRNAMDNGKLEHQGKDVPSYGRWKLVSPSMEGHFEHL
jgi:hypothetical protein